MAQASTWLQATNSTLRLASLPIITDSTKFDNDAIPKFAISAKYNIDFAHRHLTPAMVTTFTKRRFRIVTKPGIYDYVLDTGISAESLSYHTWYNVTPNSPYAGPMDFRKYEDYKDAWPDQMQVQSGPPEYAVQLPYDKDIDNPTTGQTPMVRIYPIPDNVYALEYQARLNPYVLRDHTSVILWPPEYEHGLWAFARLYLEVNLAEGREAAIAPLVDQVISRIRVVSQPAEEVRKGVRLPKLNHRRNRSSGYFP